MRSIGTNFFKETNFNENVFGWEGMYDIKSFTRDTGASFCKNSKRYCSVSVRVCL